MGGNARRFIRYNSLLIALLLKKSLKKSVGSELKMLLALDNSTLFYLIQAFANLLQ